MSLICSQSNKKYDFNSEVELKKSESLSNSKSKDSTLDHHSIKLATQEYEITRHFYRSLSFSETSQFTLCGTMEKLWGKIKHNNKSKILSFFVKLQQLYQTALSKLHQAVDHETYLTKETFEDYLKAYNLGVNIILNVPFSFTYPKKTETYEVWEQTRKTSSVFGDQVRKVEKLISESLPISAIDENLKNYKEKLFHYTFFKDMQNENCREELIQQANLYRDQLNTTIVHNARDLFFIRKEVGDLKQHLLLLESKQLKDLKKHCSQIVTVAKNFFIDGAKYFLRDSNFITQTMTNSKKTIVEEKMFLSMSTHKKHHYSVKLNLTISKSLTDKIKELEIKLNELLKKLKKLDNLEIQNSIYYQYRSEKVAARKTKLVIDLIKNDSPSSYLETILNEINTSTPDKISCNRLWDYYSFFSFFKSNRSVLNAMENLMKYFKAHYSPEVISIRSSIVENKASLIDFWKSLKPDALKLRSVILETSQSLDLLESDFDELKVYINEYVELVNKSNECFYCYTFSKNKFDDLLNSIKKYILNIPSEESLKILFDENAEVVKNIFYLMSSSLKEIIKFFENLTVLSEKEIESIDSEMDITQLVSSKKIIDQNIQIRTFAKALAIFKEKNWPIWRKLIETGSTYYKYENIDVNDFIQNNSDKEYVNYHTALENLVEFLDLFSHEELNFYRKKIHERNDVAAIELLTAIFKIIENYAVTATNDEFILKRIDSSKAELLQRFRSYSEANEKPFPAELGIIKQLLQCGEWHPKNLDEVIGSNDLERRFEYLLGGVISFVYLKISDSLTLDDSKVLKNAIRVLRTNLCENKIIADINANDQIDIVEKDETENVYKRNCKLSKINGVYFLEPVKSTPLNLYNSSFYLPRYPSSAKTNEEYKRLVNNYRNELLPQPSSYLAGLLNSVILNIPSEIVVSNMLFASKSLTIFRDSEKDILRIKHFILNGKILFTNKEHSQLKCSEEEKIKMLGSYVFQAFHWDQELVQNILKISNQAVVSGISTRLLERFNNINLEISTTASGIHVEVNTPLEDVNNDFVPDLTKGIILKYSTIYKVEYIKTKEHIQYLKGERTIKLKKEHLRKGNSEGAEIMDSISLWDSPNLL